MAKKVKRIASSSKKDDDKVFAFLATFLWIIGFIIALVVKKDNKYVMHYAKQSLVIFIASVIVWIIALVLMWIPVIGWLISTILWILIIILWLISWIYALSGEMKEVPVIGRYARMFKF